MARADRIVKQHLRTKFLITLKTGTTWSGLLVDADASTLQLIDAEVFDADGTSTKADGRVFLPRADLAYMQLA